MSGNLAYSNNFPSDWVAQSDENAELSRPSTPIQPPGQTPLSTSPLTPSLSSNAASISPQYLAYFPASWALTSSSSSPTPTPSSSPTPLLPISKSTEPSVISPKMSKPQKTPDYGTLGRHSYSHIPLRPELTERNNSMLSDTTLRPDFMTLFPTSRTNSWQRPPILQCPLVQRSDSDWTKAVEKRITVQLSPSLGRGRQASQMESDLMRQSLQPLLQNAPNWMQPQQDLLPLGLNDSSYQDSHAINTDIHNLEHIEGDEMDERYGDMPHRASAVSITYSMRASNSSVGV